MNKNTLIIIILVLVVIVGGALFFLTRGPEGRPVYQKEQLIIEQDLTPIELSPEEQQVLQDEGIEPVPSEEDIKAKALQGVRFSDELDAIEADLNETDLTGLDAELEAIESDLFGL
ncbi:hypothetical protein MYX07_07100 [Patescibacteria group bacterium AH-259-L07]|nr:hypothetical protein [Patescibacteria group bacterium AH-259-L07]